jgi:TetR/AcrR family transcriptional regulator, transcriptional repressor of aconitase
MVSDPKAVARRRFDRWSRRYERDRRSQANSGPQLAALAPHLVGEQQRNPELNAAVRAGIEGLRAGFETLARAAQERGELDRALEPEHLGRLCISLLQGLLLQVGVYGDTLDIDGYAHAVTTLIDRTPVE